VDVQVVRHGQLPGADDDAREKITRLLHLAPAPVLLARVRLTKHPDPSVARPVMAQANLDVTSGPMVLTPVVITSPAVVAAARRSRRDLTSGGMAPNAWARSR